jgi:site-specific DNA-methyltransferase (adenine-specific)
MASSAPPYLVVCTDGPAMLKRLPDDCVDAVVTDPPWNRGKRYGAHCDTMPTAGYVAWLRDAIRDAARVSRGPVAMFLGRENGRRLQHLLADTGLAVRLHLQWQRSSGIYEDVAVLGPLSGPAPSSAAAAEARHVLASFPEPSQTFGHPCPKPVRAVEALVKLVCPVGGVLLDPFMGVGSTLLAAQRQGRRAIGLELESDYCRSAIRRLSSR